MSRSGWIIFVALCMFSVLAALASLFVSSNRYETTTYGALERLNEQLAHQAASEMALRIDQLEEKLRAFGYAMVMSETAPLPPFEGKDLTGILEYEPPSFVPSLKSRPGPENLAKLPIADFPQQSKVKLLPEQPGALEITIPVTLQGRHVADIKGLVHLRRLWDTLAHPESGDISLIAPTTGLVLAHSQVDKLHTVLPVQKGSDSSGRSFTVAPVGAYPIAVATPLRSPKVDNAIYQLRREALVGIAGSLMALIILGFWLANRASRQLRHLTEGISLYSSSGVWKGGAFSGEYETIAKAVEEMIEKISALRREESEKFREETRKIRKRLAAPYTFAEIVTRSPEMIRALEMARKVSMSKQTTVFLSGESGVGKEILARAIHVESEAEGEFVGVNCSSLPATLLESELFGYEKGAFTGADRRKIGRFEKAENGTLLLDEIGDLPMELQVKLLRVLEEKSFEPLGSNNRVEVSCRVVVATHRNLLKMVTTGQFRADLYHRISGFRIVIPPLRNRTVDIPEIIAHFVAKLGGELGKGSLSISATAMERLIEYSWPGNIRELRNVLERAAILCDGIIDARDLHLAPVDKSTSNVLSPNEMVLGGEDVTISILLPKGQFSLKRVEMKVMEIAKAHMSGNVSKAAELLGIPRNRYYRGQQGDDE